MSESEFPPYTFADLSGKRWSLQITLAKRNRLKNECGFDVAKVVDAKANALGELLSDLERFIQSLWTLIEQDAAASNITPEDFSENMAGATLLAAKDAFVAAIVDFFQNPRLADVFVKNNEIVALAGQAFVDGIDVETEAKKLIASLTNAQES